MESVWYLQEVKRMMNRAKSAKNANYVHHMRRMNKISKVEIEIPDDGWFHRECEIRPQDKQLCVVIHKHGIPYPNIYQWREEFSSFVDVYEKFLMDEYEENEYWSPSFAQMSNIRFWKPLGLPEDVNERVLSEIEKWFEEDE